MVVKSRGQEPRDDVDRVAAWPVSSCLVCLASCHELGNMRRMLVTLCGVGLIGNLGVGERMGARIKGRRGAECGVRSVSVERGA